MKMKMQVNYVNVEYVTNCMLLVISVQG